MADLIDIKSTALRRLLLLLLILPLVLLTVAWQVLCVTAEVMADAPRAFRSVWRGR